MLADTGGRSTNPALKDKTVCNADQGESNGKVKKVGCARLLDATAPAHIRLFGACQPSTAPAEVPQSTQLSS
jgi:hypothetical protein